MSWYKKKPEKTCVCMCVLSFIIEIIFTSYSFIYGKIRPYQMQNRKKWWKNMPKKSLFTINIQVFFIQNKKKGSYPFAKIKLMMSKWCPNHYYKHTRPSKINWTQVHLNTISFWSSIWFFWFCWETTKKKTTKTKTTIWNLPESHRHFMLWSSSSSFFTLFLF